MPLSEFGRLVLVAVLAAVSGTGIGLSSRALVADPLEWHAASAITALDGDTLAVTMIARLADIDTGELDNPACQAERDHAEKAVQRVRELLTHPPLRVKFSNADRYGRLIVQVTAADRPIGPVLLDEGLAQRVRGFRAAWCPEDKSSAAATLTARFFTVWP